MNPTSQAEEWYHGTTLEFEQFATKGLIRRWTDWNVFLGVHFASSYELAKSFAKENAGDWLTRGRNSGKKSRVITCKLKGPAKHFEGEGEMSLVALQWLWDEGKVKEETLRSVQVLGAAYGGYMASYLRGERFEMKDDSFEGLAYSALNNLGSGKAVLVRAWAKSLREEGWHGLTYVNTVDAQRGTRGVEVAAVMFSPEDIEVVESIEEQGLGLEGQVF